MINTTCKIDVSTNLSNFIFQDIVAKLNNAIREQKLSMQATAANNQDYFPNTEEKEKI